MEKSGKTNSTEYVYHTIDDGSIVVDSYTGAAMPELILPDSIDGKTVSGIGKAAFSMREDIVSVMIPKSVKVLDTQAFYRCRTLENIIFQSDTISIGAECFAETEKLASIQFKGRVLYIGKNAFTLSGIETAEIGDIIEWEQECFSLCSKLNTVKIKSCSFFPERVFAYDIQLKIVEIEKLQKTPDETVFKGCRLYKGYEQIAWEYELKVSQPKKCAPNKETTDKSAKPHDVQPERKVVTEEAKPLSQEPESSLKLQPLAKTPKKPRIKLHEDYESACSEGTLQGYAKCAEMLATCGLSEEISIKYSEIAERLLVLDETVRKYEEVYTADVLAFLETYLPDTLSVTVAYIEYENAEVDVKILDSTQKEVIDAVKTLLIGINDKIDEIFKFASIELKAQAKALNLLMGSEGFIDPLQKL